MTDASEGREHDTQRGLCPACEHVRVIVSDKGATFYFCRLSAKDPALRRYPPQPVRVCHGYRVARVSDKD